ncbi:MULTISPECIES: efflux RND transporter periplasmic adaptor subunit [Pseudomonas syringae group]|uniref:Putative RND efflux membrane fusion protein n=1 Tax=Pseudomonas syringae pv. primulae TaxID=251707 RepID=A0A0P9Y3U1_9PSED|nr:MULTISPECIES: efflux RND transporter periplasmic adaptor subunit [Pseudomonas syringae group]KPY40227.1 putative RND efflux membrane fusion protein [Pseudomonas syringae pv. primulae]MBD8184845.1 efflux RND transporter periplasmic adaptor subunit [Pseudomonas viridiflava]MBD8200030.1 efflux RND transporter periplasmic adaptor subunit [Pseudomonas viridiflava]TKJ67622.1 efflux RND transporter periplasmic adaptor subunit [Pseudomonas viridiflava]TKK27954.1 efflux RND transporter periplasmic a
MLRRRMLIMLGVVMLLVLALAGYKAFSIYRQIQQFSAPKPPVSVAVVNAVALPWQSRLPAIGTLKAVQGVDLSLEIAGTVKALLFESGQKVRVGQPLLQLDSDVERALLGTAEADLGLAQVEHGRGSRLVGDQAISRGDFDKLAAQLKKASATVAQLKASLAKKQILAPFSGTIGIRQVDVGDYLASGTVIATLQDLSSLYVDFHVPEQALPKLSVGQRVQVSVSAYPGQSFDATISAINPRVDESTRNVLIRATQPNPDGRLLPGMFVDLQVILPSAPSQIVVPESAITYSLYGNSIYVVVARQTEAGKPESDTQDEPQLTVERRFVKTGEHREGKVVILEGLKAGDQVVSGGQLKLDNGAHVAISADATQTSDSNAPASRAQ